MINPENVIHRIFQVLFTVGLTFLTCIAFLALQGTPWLFRAFLGTLFVGCYLMIWEVELHNLLFHWTR